VVQVLLFWRPVVAGLEYSFVQLGVADFAQAAQYFEPAVHRSDHLKVQMPPQGAGLLVLGCETCLYAVHEVRENHHSSYRSK
jgi:hypothetical protein